MIVTGAAQGIGRGTAEVAAREGAIVIACDINPEGARRTSSQLVAEGACVRAHGVDATRRAGIRGILVRTRQEFGRVDGLVCAGMRRTYAPAERFADDDWDMVIEQGLSGYFRCAQETARVMLDQPGGGSIVLITSTASRTAVEGGVAYCSVKSAASALARQLGVEWAARGVRVNAVAPGYTRTEGAMRPLDEADARRSIPIGRAAEPTEIGEVCVFLLSERSSYVTAQEIFVDGGMSVGRGVGGSTAGVAR
ncbi:MAG: SDR family NAD(P)-dependent oxidoreductase [Ilumatobacteraceae bacterium]